MSLLSLGRFRWPTADEIDSRLEQKSGLGHQAIRVQDEAPATSDPFALALWKAHQERMARRIGAIDSGGPEPDIARRDPYALRALAVLGLVVAWSFSLSNLGGRVSDAFTFSSPEDIAAASRIDAWLTPPAYTGAAPIYLTAQRGAKTPSPKADEPVVAPQFSVLTVRVSGPAAEKQASFTPAGSDKDVLLTPDKPTAEKDAAKPAETAPESVSYTVKLRATGRLHWARSISLSSSRRMQRRPFVSTRSPIGPSMARWKSPSPLLTITGSPRPAPRSSLSTRTPKR